MVPVLPASVVLFALSLVTFSSLLFLAMLRMQPLLRTLGWPDHGVSRYQGRGRNPRFSSSEEVDCSVCLSKLEVGEEIKELGCDHVFHVGCFDRWARHCRYATCPLCRRVITSAAVAVEEDGTEVLSFRLWDFGNRDGGGNWWLR